MDLWQILKFEWWLNRFCFQWGKSKSLYSAFRQEKDLNEWEFWLYKFLRFGLLGASVGKSEARRKITGQCAVQSISHFLWTQGSPLTMLLPLCCLSKLRCSFNMPLQMGQWLVTKIVILKCKINDFCFHWSPVLLGKYHYPSEAARKMTEKPPISELKVSAASGIPLSS